MEELQDAIEDAQYVNAIATQDDGPRPVLAWEKPSELQVQQWIHEKKPQLDDMEWVLSHALGYFLFSQFIKKYEYVRMNFCEDVLRLLSLPDKARGTAASSIVKMYLLPPTPNSAANRSNSEITETDLARSLPRNEKSREEVQKLLDMNMDWPERTESMVGLKGTMLKDARECLERLPGQATTTRDYAGETSTSSSTGINGVYAVSSSARKDLAYASSVHELGQRRWKQNNFEISPGEKLLINTESLVMESLRRDYWDGFRASELFINFRNFLWYQDRRVIPEDFFTMRVLGRGGFGLVYASKKGTSGKLYAMKVMNKRRIKMKRSEQLATNEREALGDLESPFVVNLKYSFHSKDDVFLILDLMTGGDLAYHLQLKGRFSKKECQYYAARIMLGVQDLHNAGYVYRDLKPENCLLADDGRMKITDLGLAVKLVPDLHGAAGTRGYWAPEMLRRDKKGRRTSYGQTVDWFSFGCCIAEFISGTNPFRCEAALQFGLDKGMQTKEKAVDCATLEMDPEFPPEFFEPDAADFCKKLLDKNERTRLGANGCEQIMAHPWFKNLSWESIVTDSKRPPFVPPKDVNAASQSEIGQFTQDQQYQETSLDENDELVYKNWDWTNPRAFAAEVIEFLIYERQTGRPLVPISQGGGCCDIL